MLMAMPVLSRRPSHAGAGALLGRAGPVVLWLFGKRLEQGRLVWPLTAGAAPQLAMLL